MIKISSRLENLSGRNKRKRKGKISSIKRKKMNLEMKMRRKRNRLILKTKIERKWKKNQTKRKKIVRGKSKWLMRTKKEKKKRWSSKIWMMDNKIQIMKVSWTGMTLNNSICKMKNHSQNQKNPKRNKILPRKINKNFSHPNQIPWISKVMININKIPMVSSNQTKLHSTKCQKLSSKPTKNKLNKGNKNSNINLRIKKEEPPTARKNILNL